MAAGFSMRQSNVSNAALEIASHGCRSAAATHFANCESLMLHHESFDVREDVLLAGGVQGAIASADIIVCASRTEEFVRSSTRKMLCTSIHLYAVNQKFASFTHSQASSGYGMTPVRSASTNISPSMTGL